MKTDFTITLLFCICLLFTSGVSGQEKASFSFSGFLTPLLELGDYSLSGDGSRSASPALELGLGLDHSVNSRLSLVMRAGYRYSSIKNKVDSDLQFGDQYNPDGTLDPSTGVVVNNIVVHYLGISLGSKYYLNPTKKLYLIGAIHYLYKIGQSGNRTFERNIDEPVMFDLLASEAFSPRKSRTSLSLGGGKAFSLKSKMILSIEPFLEYGLNGHFESTVSKSRRSHSAGLRLGVEF